MSTTGVLCGFPSIGEIVLIPKEEEYCVEWRIKKFFSVWDQDTVCKWSPDFKLGDITWHLRLLPNGNKSKYLNIGLFKLTYTTPIYVEFSFSLKNSDGLKEFERYCADIFEGWCVNPIVVDKIVSRSDLVKRSAEFLDSGQLTVLCTVKRSQSATSPGANISRRHFCFEEILDADRRSFKKQKCLDVPMKSARVTVACSYCKQSFDSDKLSCHEQKCLEKPIKCSDCSEAVKLQNLFYHECHSMNVKQCSYCRKLVDQKKLSCHEKFCKNSPIQCPECSIVIPLQNWNDHKCDNIEDSFITISRTSFPSLHPS